MKLQKKVIDVLNMKDFEGKAVILYVNGKIRDTGLNFSLFKSLWGDLKLDDYKINNDNILAINAKA